MIQEAAMVLHNKQCPYGYRCRASDCIECQEEYEKVDGLASNANGGISDVCTGIPVRCGVHDSD